MSQGVFTFTFFEAVHKILLPWFSIALCRWIPMCVSVFLFCTPPLPPLTAIRLGKQPSPSDVCLLNNWDSHCSVASEWPQRLPITSPLLSGQYPKPAPKHQNLPPPKKKINTSGYLAFCTHFQLKHIEVLENWYLYFYWLVVFFFYWYVCQSSELFKKSLCVLGSSSKIDDVVDHFSQSNVYSCSLSVNTRV